MPEAIHDLPCFLADAVILCEQEERKRGDEN